MKKSLVLLLAAALLAPSASLAQDEDGDEEPEAEAPAGGTHAEENEEAPAAPPAPARAPRKAYTAPVKRSASNYTAEQASPAPAADDEEDASEAPEHRPAPAPRETRRAVSTPAVAPVAHGAGGGSSCGAVPRRVRTYRLADHDDMSFYCKDAACASSVQLKHALYPSVIKVGALSVFAERCDFRNDTACPVPGGYQDKAGLNTTSVHAGIPVGGDASAGGYAETLVPIVGLAPRYAAFDLSIPFEIDRRMAGRTFLMDYTINTNNPDGLQVSISACEGDFSRQAIFLKAGDFLNYLVLASSGLEGNARSRADTTRNLMALKAGKRYYLNVRRVKADLDDPSDSLPDEAIHPYALARQMSRNHLLSQEFYRLGFHSYPAGNPMELKESEFASKPGFRRPGQGL